MLKQPKSKGKEQDGGPAGSGWSQGMLWHLEAQSSALQGGSCSVQGFFPPVKQTFLGTRENGEMYSCGISCPEDVHTQHHLTQETGVTKDNWSRVQGFHMQVGFKVRTNCWLLTFRKEVSPIKVTNISKS